MNNTAEDKYSLAFVASQHPEPEATAGKGHTLLI
jgi:hypothetical protein